MIHVTIQTLCQVIIAIAAIKYLMPDIRKLCRKIGEEPKREIEEHKERKEKKYVSAKKVNKSKENIEQILPIEKQKEAEVKAAETDKNDVETEINAENAANVSDAEIEAKPQECQQEEDNVNTPATEMTIPAAAPEELPEWPDDISAAPAAEVQKNI